MKVRFAIGPGSDAGDRGALIAFADALEATGFDGVWLSDIPLEPVLDPLLALALIAGRTRRLRLGANVVPLGRNPFLLAKELAQLDQLSGGRLLLSFVTGLGHPREREALGLEGSRGGALEQTLARVRDWWGREHAARPVQDRLEVWLGGRGPKALDRVGRVADGWLGAMLTPSESAFARERIQESAARAGREVDPEHFGMSIPYARSTPDEALLSSLRARRADVDPLALLPVGVPALRELIAAYVEAGLSKFVVRPAERIVSWEDEAGWLGEAILGMQT
ncbi:MAG TPA: LLM class flavin-dependent oxidoreductase [Solirubrobacteraceae bacterium]|nr:LLM class flavin-dependent oxidoreductase [Solirubrobacteraceae bacterium]